MSLDANLFYCCLTLIEGYYCSEEYYTLFKLCMPKIAFQKDCYPFILPTLNCSFFTSSHPESIDFSPVNIIVIPGDKRNHVHSPPLRTDRPNHITKWICNKLLDATIDPKNLHFIKVLGNSQQFFDAFSRVLKIEFVTNYL